MLLMIDNYDSFTYNLVQYFGELGEKVIIYRNDKISINEIAAIAPDFLVISPGPCTPNKAGISIESINKFAGKIPILGVCLGFQSIVQAYGGNIINAKKVMHGKISAIHHNNKNIFTNLKNPLNATRYHSLVAEQSSIPKCLDITSYTKNDDGSIDEIMGVRHKNFQVEGVQFHPESIITEEGHKMLNNFLQGE